MLPAHQLAARLGIILAVLLPAGLYAQAPIILTVAGSSQEGFSGDGGHATLARLRSPCCVTVDSQGNLFISDAGNHRIRKVTPEGIISTLAGTGEKGSQGDNGPAAEAQLRSPGCMAVDAADNLYFADTDNHRIRKITPEGIISTVAGAGKAGYGGDGEAAASALLSYPVDVAIDSTGNLYIADTGNHRIRKITPEGIISTVAGAGKPGYGGDNGPATSALLSYPARIALDSAGNLYIADTGNHRIRKVSPEGIISTVAGTGKAGYGGDDGPAVSAQLNNPFGLAVDSVGNLYIADTGNSRIRKVNPAGIISTVAGTDPRGYGGDRQAANAAQLDNPFGVAVGPAGTLFIADTRNHCIRMVAEPERALCTVACNASAPSSAPAGQQVRFSATASTQGCSGGLSYQWAFSSGLRESAQAVNVTFPEPGSFSWTMTAWSGFAACAKSGVINITTPEASHSLRLRAMDELRTPSKLTASPGQTLYWHYRLETEAGAAVSGTQASLALSTTGFNPSPDAFTFQIEGPGHLVVKAEVDKLNLPPYECSFSFRLGTGTVKLDGDTYALVEAPPAVSLSLSAPPTSEAWEIPGEEPPGSYKTPLGASLRVERTRNSLPQAGHAISITRRFPLLQAPRLSVAPFQPRPRVERVPPVGAPIGRIYALTGTQTLSYSGNSDKEARLLYAAFLLESLAMTGAPLPPIAGPLLAAILDCLNETTSLISPHLLQRTAGITIADPGVPSPQIFEQQSGFSRDQQLPGQEYLTRIRWIGREAFQQLGPGAALLNGMPVLEAWQELRLSPAAEPVVLEAVLEGAQAPAPANLPSGASSPLQVHTVRFRYQDSGVLATLRGAFPTLASLWSQGELAAHSEPITTVRQAAEQILQMSEFARQTATGTAYEVTRVASSLRATPTETNVTVAFPTTGRNVELSFSLPVLHRRILAQVARSVVIQGREWKLSEWNGSLEESPAPELSALLREEVFAGLGAWIEQAWRRRVTELSVVTPRAGFGSLEIRDRVTQNLVATLSAPAEYAGVSFRILSYSPERPEATGFKAPSSAEGTRWRYTSSRISGKSSPSSAYLLAAGNVVEIAVSSEGGSGQASRPAFQPPLRVTFMLDPARLSRYGLDDKELAGVRIYRYDTAEHSWSLTPSSLAPDGRSVMADLTQPGVYMPARELVLDPADSDQDGLPDQQEDLNGNGFLDAGETHPYLCDTDGDGVPDGEERRVGTDPTRASSHPNRPPVLAFIGNHKVQAGATLELQAAAWDADDQPLRFFAFPLPPGAEFDASTGRLRWTPATAGEYRIELRVSDGALSDTQQVLLVVEPGQAASARLNTAPRRLARSR